MKWSFADIHQALPDAEFQNDFNAEDLIGVNQWQIDSRALSQGDGFLAFSGEKVDGHDYVKNVALQGGTVALVNKFQNIPDTPHRIAQIKVGDMQNALWQLAKYARSHQPNCRFIAITGSVGKSSTRSLAACALSVMNTQVYASQGNFNNHLGMPLCLANMGINTGYDLAIFELGMNHSGELAPLSQLLRPDLAMVLNIAPVHIENFADIQALAQAKAEIFKGLSHDGWALIPKGAYSEILRNSVPIYAQFKTILDDQADYVWQKQSLYCRPLEQSFSYPTINEQQRFQTNILAVLEMAAKLYGHQLERITTMLEAVSHWQPEQGRGQLSTLSLSQGNVKVMDDSYNASVLSMLGMLNDLVHQKARRKILVLGDMKELGDYSDAAHREVLHAVDKHDFAVIFLVGEAIQSQKHLLSNPPIVCTNATEVAEKLAGILSDGDLVAIKASHSMGLGAVVPNIKSLLARKLAGKLAGKLAE